MFLKSAEAPVISVSEAALIPPGDGHTNTLHVFLLLRVSESQVSMERVILVRVECSNVYVKRFNSSVCMEFP